jgi:hypothetical protein
MSKQHFLIPIAILLISIIPSGVDAKVALQNPNTYISLARQSSENPQIPPAKAKQIIASRAKEVILLLKKKDFAKLSTVIHPDKGVRFSPYAYVIGNEDKVFTARKIKTLTSDKTKYIWGAYDGSGELIQLAFRDYYKRFVYSRDFAAAKQIGYNRFIGGGNTINNAFQAYPKSIIVEYHLTGFEAKYGGMDWESLRLVFEEKKGAWYLVGIIHDQWTI